MAGTKLTGLAQATTAALTDWLYAAISGNSRKIQVQNLPMASYVLASADPSAVSAVVFNLPSGWEEYELSGWLTPANADIPWLRLSNDGGSTFRSGASDYTWSHIERSSTQINSDFQTDSKIVTAPFNVGAAAGELWAFKVRIVAGRESGRYTTVLGENVRHSNGGEAFIGSFAGAVQTAEINDAVRLLFSSNNIAAGHITLIGIKGS